MKSAPEPTLIVSNLDYRRIQAVLDNADAHAPVVEQLQHELTRADLREPGDIPPDVVTMNSEVLFLDERSGAERRVRLVYPKDANASLGHVSLLAPVGAALLGLSVGQGIDWPLPNGQSTRLRVQAIEYQPEAYGLAE